MMKVLVLDKAWMPSRIVTWKQAMTWVFQERVDVLSSYEEMVYSAKEGWFIPSVIRMRAGQTRHSRIVRFSRSGVWTRDGGRCQYCSKEVARNELTLDHIVPRTHGGPTTWANVVTCCFDCNQKKGSQSLAECGFTLSVSPKKPTVRDLMLQDLRKITTLPADWLPYLPELNASP